MLIAIPITIDCAFNMIKAMNVGDGEFGLFSISIMEVRVKICVKIDIDHL